MVFEPLMLDTNDFKGGIWSCHSFDRRCLDITAFVSNKLLTFLNQIASIKTHRILSDVLSFKKEPARDTFKEIEAFLSANPTEIVTIILEDYVETPNDLTKVFKWKRFDEVLVSCLKDAAKRTRLAAG